MLKIFRICSFLLFFLVGSGHASIWTEVDEQLQVSIRGGLDSVSVKTTIHENTTINDGKRIIFTHGFVHTANSFGPLLDMIKNDVSLSSKISQIITYNQPNRAGSDLPVSIRFDRLNMWDYADIFLGTMSGLKALGYSSDTFFGHSLGAAVAMIAQDKLLQDGSSLFLSHGISKAMFLAPSVPNGLDWYLVDSGLGEVLVYQPFAIFDNVLGAHISIPTPNWIGLFFSDRTQTIVASAPSIAEVENNEYNAVAPASVTFQLGSQQGRFTLMSRKPFKNAYSTKLTTVALSQDLLLFETEAQATHKFLGGKNKNFEIITDVEAVHDTYISRPDLLITPLIDFL